MISTNPLIRIKRSSVPGKIPTVDQLVLGELALNISDADLYTLRARTGFSTDVVRIGAGVTVTNILYVTKDGNDNNTGKKLGDAKATIKGAIAESKPGTVIKVSAGTYIEDNPITVPNQVSVVGDSLREVTVTPQNDGDLFYIGAGNYFAEMSFIGAPNRGAIFSFDPVSLRYINQSPYIQNCTNFIPNSIGLKIDGNNAIGPLKSMVLDSYTQYNQGGIGVSITNEGYAQLVSLFTICDDIAVFTGSGAACDLTNSNSSFGNYALVSDGVGPLKYTGIITSAAPANSDRFVLDLNTPTLNITNALYDNKTGILTAYTSAPHKFSVGMGITLSSLEFTCAGIGGTAYYPNGAYEYIFEVKTVAPGRYVDAYNSIQSNRREILDKSIAAIALNYPNFYFPGDVQTTQYSRFYDSYRLIQKNKQEIIDKSLASIAVGFPSSFYFPTEAQTNSQSRYYDAYNLIIRNKQEIIDKSLASIAVGFPTGFYFPTEAQTNSQSRYYDAYNLIINNKQEIVDNAWNLTVTQYPELSGTISKCKRDIGYFVDAVATDVFIGGNKYSRDFALQYFDNSGTFVLPLSQQQASIYAFQQAEAAMDDAITNQLTYKNLSITADPITGSNIDPNSCANVQTTINTLTDIVTTVIGAGDTSSLSTFNENLGISTTNKCARDLGYFVDAIATDVFTGGNRYARSFALQYFDNAGNPISNGLVGEEQPSIYAFNTAGTLMRSAITNQLNYKNLIVTADPLTGLNTDPASCANVQSAISSLVGIVTTVIGAGNTSSLLTFNDNLGISTTNKCARDIGYFVDAISTDLFTGGNSYSIDFTKQYFDASGNPISNGLVGEELPSIYAFQSARDYAKKAITNQLNYKELSITADPLTGFNTSPNSCANVQSAIDTLSGIVTTVIGSGSLNSISGITVNNGVFVAGQNKCKRDVGYIVDAVSLDVRDLTNKNSINAAKAYFDNNGNPILNGLYGEESQSIVAFHAARDLMKLAITNSLNNKNLSLAPDPLTNSNTDPASCANVRTFIDNLVGIITTPIGNGNLNSIPSVSIASTVFTTNVGTSTTPNQVYVSGGTANISVSRPFDGQVVYFDKLYYSVDGIEISNGGSGYVNPPVLEIDPPQTEWGVTAQALANVSNGKISSIEIVSSGRGYTNVPRVTIISQDVGITTAKLTANLSPSYSIIQSSTPVSAGICTITLADNVPYAVGVGTQAYFYKQSRILASGHSLEYIGAGITIANSLPWLGGVPIQENETVSKNGGLVVFTSTDHSGNFRIGDGIVINQQTGSISGSSYTKSLFSTLTPFILALGGD